MTPTIDTLSHALARGARIAGIACLTGLLLAGCATTTTTTQESDPPLALSRTSTLDSNAAPRAAIPADSARRVSPTLARAKVRADSTPDGLPVVEVEPPATVARSIDLTDDTDDLLQRLRNGFSMPDINNDLVLSHQQWYLNRPDYLRRVLERSSRYMHFIVEELDKRGMPMELALLPMVESAYNPMALSRAKASGLWQFIPATGKRYNLDQNWWKDERRDIVASTTAALDYLQSIYDMHGDWHLALASYNWGEGAVGRAIAKNQAQGLPTDYLSLNMPAETRNYVPKLQALKNIFRNPNLLAELNLPSIPNRPYFATVTKTANIDVKVAAELAEMPVQEFVALNPAHNRPVIPSDTTMVIPADKIDTFLSNLQVHEENNKPLSLWQAYIMRPGDRLEKIAPRFGMTVANLKEANGIQGRIKLGPGYTLLVAGKDGGGVSPLPEQPRLPVADPEPREPRSSARSHTVRKGETLPAIAKRYGVSVAEIRHANRLRSDKVAAGDVLALADADDARSTRSPAGKANAGTKDAKTAKVEKNEKAQKADKLAKSEATGKNAKASPGGKAPQVASKAKAPRTTRYTIRRGDTLSSIARQFNVDKDDLLRWNHLSPNVLTPGKTLTIQLAQNP
jgi:membrane-bound lytic murein transglycosylase D